MLYLIYLSGIVWLIPLSLFAPSVWRIWVSRADLIDIMLGIIAFFSANQVGYCLRWALFNAQIKDMSIAELAMWSGLYTLSIVSALSAVAAWRIVRRVV